MTHADRGGTAFPNPLHAQSFGMSLRDYTAISILNGMISSCPMVDRTAVNKEVWSRIAYEWADAMIAERNKS